MFNQENYLPQKLCPVCAVPITVADMYCSEECYKKGHRA